MYGKKKKEYLKGGQVKLDMNKDGKLTGADFKMLGNKKMMMGGMINADKEFMYGGMMKSDKKYMAGGKMKNSYNKGGLMQHD